MPVPINRDYHQQILFKKPLKRKKRQKKKTQENKRKYHYRTARVYFNIFPGLNNLVK
jgi:hypothetical protein